MESLSLMNRGLQQANVGLEKDVHTSGSFLFPTIIAIFSVFMFVALAFEFIKAWVCRVCLGREEPLSGEEILANMSENERRAVLEEIFSKLSKTATDSDVSPSKRKTVSADSATDLPVIDVEIPATARANPATTMMEEGQANNIIPLFISQNQESPLCSMCSAGESMTKDNDDVPDYGGDEINTPRDEDSSACSATSTLNDNDDERRTHNIVTTMEALVLDNANAPRPATPPPLTAKLESHELSSSSNVNDDLGATPGVVVDDGVRRRRLDDRDAAAETSDGERVTSSSTVLLNPATETTISPPSHLNTASLDAAAVMIMRKNNRSCDIEEGNAGDADMPQETVEEDEGNRHDVVVRSEVPSGSALGNVPIMMSPVAVDRRESVATSAAGSGSDESMGHACPICLGGYRKGDMLIVAKHCNHLFHIDCILEWLANHENCPICRVKMVTEDEMVEAAISLLKKTQTTGRRRL